MKKFFLSNLPVYILIGGLIVTVLLLTHPLGFDNYGYDYGFYSYAVQHTPLDSPAYFAGQVNDYGNHLFVILNWLRLPQIPTLNFLFVLFFVLSGILFYEIIKKYGRLATVTGIILFIFSIAQSQLYNMYLWKAAYGQVLLLLIFWLIQQNKKYRWEFIPLVILFITHKTTSIMALISLVPHYIFGVIKNKLIVLGVAILGALLFLFQLNGLHYIKQLLDSNVLNGIFMQTNLYLKYAWPLIPLASIGVYKSLATKTNLTWLGLLGISLVFIIFNIAFYQRLILYADLALIFFSVITIDEQKGSPNLQKLLFALVLLIMLSNFFAFTKAEVKPQITDSEITEITNFTKGHQGAFVLALSSQDGPWLLANLEGNNRLAAPGLYEDKYSQQSWQRFWENPKDKTFLNKYPKPLYLYERATVFYLEPWECLKQTSPHFYEYTCAN